MLVEDKLKAAADAAERQRLRRELLQLILKNEARRKAQAKAALPA
jgi:hypothetical protein